MRQPHVLFGVIVLGGVVTLSSGCGGDVRDTRGDAGAGAWAPGATAAATPSSASTTGVVTLTGCLVRDTVSSEFTLANVATGGAPVVPADATNGSAGQRREDREQADADVEARAALAAGSSYRLIAEADEAEELNEAVGKRVTVRGQLAHPAPAAAPVQPETPSGGVPAGATATGATVRGAAGELRALRVQAVRAVGDACG